MEDYLTFSFTPDDNLTQPYVTPTTKIAVSLLICVFGLIGNLVVILIILTLREYKKSSAHWYVLQLAIADSLFLLTLPFQVVEDLEGKWIFPEWLCKMKETILFLNYYASIIFLMIMTIDRYVAICHPIKAKLHKAPTLLVTLITWSVSLLVCIPVMLLSVKVGTSPHCICAFVHLKAVNQSEICILDGLDPLFCHNVYGPLDSQSYCRQPTQELLEGVDIPFPNYAAYHSGEVPDYNYYYNEANSTQSLDKTCSYEDQGVGFKAYLIFNFVAMFILPFILMTSCYTLIIVRLSRGQHNLPIHHSIERKNVQQNHSNQHGNHNNQHGNHNNHQGNHNNQHGNHTNQHGNNVGHHANKRRKSSTTTDKDLTRITVMFIALVVVFGLCWIPFHGFHIARIVGFSLPPDSTFCETFPVIATLLGYSNAAINPFLYTFMLKNFVKRLRNTSRVIRVSFVGSSAFKLNKQNSRELKVSETSLNRHQRTENSTVR